MGLLLSVVSTDSSDTSCIRILNQSVKDDSAPGVEGEQLGVNQDEGV